MGDEELDGVWGGLDAREGGFEFRTPAGVEGFEEEG